MKRWDDTVKNTSQNYLDRLSTYVIQRISWH